MKIRSSQQAFEDVQRLATSYPGIIAVFQDIAQIASIESAADAAEKKLAGVKNEIKQAQADLEALGSSHDERIRKHDAAVAARLAAAEQDIAGRMAAAEKEVATLKAAAQANLDSANKELERIVTAAKVAAAAIDNRAASAQTQLDTLHDDIATAQTTLDGLNGQIGVIEQHKANLAAALQATG